MAFVGRPRVLLLDEPTSGISAEEKFPFMSRVMEALSRDKATVFIIEHDMDIIQAFVSRVLAFAQGRIICDASRRKRCAIPTSSPRARHRACWPLTASRSTSPAPCPAGGELPLRARPHLRDRGRTARGRPRSCACSWTFSARGGVIEFDGAEITRVPASRRLHLGFGYMPEDRRLIPNLSVEENVLMPLTSLGKKDAARLDGLYSMIPEVKELRSRMPSSSRAASRSWSRCRAR